MQAIILAAGMGKRLRELTKDNTKCMVEINGTSLIDRMLHQIEKYNISRIVIVVGYKAQKLIDYISTLNISIPVLYIYNPIFDKTNNIYSLSLAKDYLYREDTLLFESDLIFEDSVINELLEDERDTLALVDKYESWMDGTCVKLSDDDSIEMFISKKQFKFNEIKNYYKTVNIYKFSKEFSKIYYIPFLEAYTKALGNNEYYEQVLRVITMLNDTGCIKAKRLTGQLWYEIDDIQDLDIASSMFAENEDEKLSFIQKRYGGYWRYPKLIDFCYPVNTYFPPQRLTDELKANFETLLTRYPSGMEVNSLLAAKNFNVSKNNILTGNGAGELIKELMSKLSGITGFIKPTFEEYTNRYDKEKSLYFTPDNRDFSYTAADIMNFFGNKTINNLILINPDNPSGNYIPKRDIIDLLNWSETNKINIIIDESFVDFADEDGTIIAQNIINSYSRLCIIKSISKSYGVPGLRLGILASGNTDMISELKREASIWNVNSFAEFYMQIEEKYKEEYIHAIELFKTERNNFAAELNNINGIRVIPSQANYIMAELINGMTAKELTKTMLIKYNLLIKDLSAKIQTGQYIRLAVRDKKDNDRLIRAFQKEFLGKADLM